MIEQYLGESSTKIITLTPPFLTSRLIFNLSSINLIIAGNTFALPDHVKTLSILDFGIGLGSCFNSDSSKTRRTIGILESFDLILVLSEIAEVQYKTNEYWDKSAERSLKWDEEEINIKWPLKNNQPILSKKDKLGINFSKIL